MKIVTYPEHEKLKAVQHESQAIGAFLDQMQGEGVFLAKYDESSECAWPIRESIQKTLADYFEIDLVKLEKEKEAMLAQIRAAS